MQIFKEIGPFKAFLVEKRNQGLTVGFVATMGALHQGHLELIRNSQNENSITVCSIFVNPSQFNDPADLQKYPRTLDQDSKLLNKAGCHALFCPEVETMYGKQSSVHFNFGYLDKVMEGEFRPGHFSGVARVVSKLFHIVEPDVAYFGQKDWQQFVIISHLVDELKFNLKVKSVPTLREVSGLAMSSRNARLTVAQREKAAGIYQALKTAVEQIENGKSISYVKTEIKTKFLHDPEMKLEYVEVTDSETLLPINDVSQAHRSILCIAIYIGEIRLIDNMFLYR